MDLNQYTQKSLEALRSAQQLAVTHQNQQLEQAHLLLALLRQEGGLVPQLLKRLGVTTGLSVVTRLLPRMLCRTLRESSFVMR